MLVLWLLAQTAADVTPDGALSWAKVLSSLGSLGILGGFGYLVTRGTFRHARELDAKQKELDYERAERVRERSENDAAVARLQKELDDTNKQLLSVLETGRRSQQIAQQSLEVVNRQAPNVRAD